MSFKPKILIQIALSLAISLSFALQVNALTYDIEAKVSAEIASSPAEITSPTAGQNFTESQIVVSGTCPSTTPAQIVVIRNNGSFAGSGGCSAGTFSISITLNEGENNLLPKIKNITGDSGPDGSTVSVTYTPSATPASTTPALSGLKLITQDNFVVFDSAGLAKFAIIIEGGDPPYIFSVDWGDGSSDEYTFDTAGEKILEHAYSSTGNKSISITVKDSSGQSASVTIGAVSISPKAKIVTKDLPKKPSALNRSLSKSDWIAIGGAYLFTVTLLLSATSGGSVFALITSNLSSLIKKSGKIRGIKIGKK